MNHLGEPSTSKQDNIFEDDEIFDDSTFLSNFDSTTLKQTKVFDNNVNDSNNTSALNVSALCCDEEISGYDKLTGQTWIYPTNYPVRDYQFNIIKAAILKNTLVSLPTGLGKTFIAAVIMYNFYRWYPLGKIIFTAPTRPLVAQQIDACYNIIAIPPNDTIEMTGHMQVNTRKAHWQNKRVFFATPQVIYNDLKSGICPAVDIRCLVIDEAHKARGNYAYCQIVATLDEMGHKTYRMLALSATPGSKVDDVINVVRSLHIAHLELRTENCIDVSPYSHSRNISTVIVQLGPELSQLRQQYVEILDGYARRLKQFNILPQNLGNLSKGRIVMLYKEYQTKDRGARHAQHNYIMKDFTLLIALYHGLELLVKHGSRVFLNFFDEHPEKSWIQSDDRLTALLERLRDDLGVNPLSLDRSILPDGSIPEMPKDLCFGHPKFDKLKSIILEHFTCAKRKNQDTRAIIFCEYRESVNLVHCLLLQCRPLITPQMFVGQGASGKDGKAMVSQKQQLRVMRSFREGACNTLVATCVAEEGLDVGSVDLIICFDISTRSPIRLVQRCGRTGRERGGQVYILVTEGREHQTLMDCMRQRDGLNKKILQSKEVGNNLYKMNPRMMPHGFTPECQKMFITVAKKNDSKDAAGKPSKKVSLPTGLGKTFIAAVIMYNFYRWYPLGKIIFTAPTRPLVAQQIDACYNIIAIPPNDTIEMTGHMQVNTRKAHWQNKRVFFATPQVIYNDLKSGICPAVDIRCLVIDEAHKARGNYAYCQIVATLDEMGHKTYRMLALSATPGSKVDDVINVVRSLHIAHLELRTENCIDVSPYSHSRNISTVIVQLGPELSQLRQQYVEILDGYARRLKQFNILPQNLGNLSKGRIVMLYKEYQTKDRGARHAQHNYIMKDFTLLIALYHGLELLVKHGSRVFLNFFDEHPEKSWIQSDDRLTALLERLRDDLGVNPLSLDRSILPDGSIPEMPKDLCFGHPKFDKLKSIILEHFTCAKRKNQDTRAIIFCEYRESVNLVHCLLLQCRPLITPQMFVGQGASGKDGKAMVSQKQQLRVMRSFREGACNTLVATCVAEEGLDVGSVDLIICFDISTRSPIRLVQRCGRTGRERGGQVYILVTEGREHQTLMDCMRQRDGLNKKILQSKEVGNNLYKMNPRMMPHGFTPECQKMFITVAKKNDSKDAAGKPSKKGQKDLRSMLQNNRHSSGTSSPSKEIDNTGLITEEEFKTLFPDGYHKRNLFRKPSNYWAMNKETLKAQAMETNQEKVLNLSSWLEWQRTLQKTVNVGHSKDSEFLSNILQKCDKKRLEPSQNPVISTPEKKSQNIVFPILQSPVKTAKQAKKKQKVPVTKSPVKNYGDIRALFSTTTKSTKSYTKLINDLGIQNDGSTSTQLINLLVDLNLNVDANNVKKCYVCQNICDCKTIQNLRKSHIKPPVLMNFLKEPILPNLDLIDDLDSDTIIKYGKSIEASRDTLNCDVQNVTICKEKDNLNCSSNFDLVFDFDSLDEHKSPVALEEENATEINLSTDKNFDIGDLDDIFANSSPEEVTDKTIRTAEETEKNKQDKPTVARDALDFFGLDSIDDIFADYEDDFNEESSITKTIEVNENNITSSAKRNPGQPNVVKEPEKVLNNKPKETYKKSAIEPLKEENVPNAEYPVSPSILSGKQIVKEIPTSPILCSQTRRFQLSTKKGKPQSSTPNSSVKKKLVLPEPDNINVIVIDDDKDDKTLNTVADTTNKSMFTITQIVEMINKTENQPLLETISKNKDVSAQEHDERSTSPILLTQADRKKSININSSKSNHIIPNSNKSESLIILDSDSDFEDTLVYDVKEEISKIDENVIYMQNTSQACGKRKFDHDESLPTASPYFNKRQKTDNVMSKQLTLQEKVLAAITSNKVNDNDKNENNNPSMKNNYNLNNFHFTVSQPNFFSQKENHNPVTAISKPFNNTEDEIELRASPIDILQKYRKESKILTLRSKFDSIFKSSPKKLKESPKKNKVFDESDDFVIDNRVFSPKCNTLRTNNKENTPVKRKISFDESDDDFTVDDKNSSHSPKKPDKIRSTTNHKVRKKKRNRNSFIEMEASLSDDCADSGDELTDDSAGSIADFICDDADVTRQEDIQAIYLKSVRSPLKKNGFKIPELPRKYQKEDVFSQFVEEDSYEMDSFCVDSHVGLTQANDISELELAEIVLEEERRSKKKRRLSPLPQENGESPLIRRKNKMTKRQIHSDSDDSS